MRNAPLMIAAFLFATLSTVVHAALLDNFQTYTPGTVAATGNNATTGVWKAVGSNNSAIQNNAGNLMLSVGQSGGNSSGAWRSLPSPIANNTTATVFMRIRANAMNVDGSFGLSDVAAPSTANFNDYEPQFRLIDTSPTSGVIDLEARNGANYQDMTTNITPLTWYNVWMVINSTSNTWDAYVNTGNANATAANLVGSSLLWRNGGTNTNTLTTLLVLGGTSTDNLAQNIDDIYVNSGVVLTNFNPDKLGDTDGDGIVEFNDDFGPIRNNFGAPGLPRAQGDLNRDGIIEFADFREWKNAFIAGGGSLEDVDLNLTPLTVPEPSSYWIVFLAVVTLPLVTDRRRFSRPQRFVLSSTNCIPGFWQRQA